LASAATSFERPRSEAFWQFRWISHLVKAERLAKYHDISRFDCGDEDINDFLKNDALRYQERKIATTTIFIHNDEIIGFFSAAADSLKLRLEEKESAELDHKLLPEFPAMKIARLGETKGLEGSLSGPKSSNGLWGMQWNAQRWSQ
jgi:hypothetical protein